MTFVFFVVGLVLLIVGAELLVRGSSRLAAAIGISPLIIGLTVVAFGTSSPELVVSVQASLGGNPNLAMGNVIGSNIFNVLLILGLSAAIAPLIVSQQLIRLDVPLMIAISALTWFFAQNGAIDRWEGLLLFMLLVGYIIFSIYVSRREGKAVQEEYAEAFGVPQEKRGNWIVDMLFVVIGLGGLALGSRWLVESATIFAQALGVSPFIIGLTIVAAGTSLPEVATSVLASIRGERDIAVGNVVGSNIFNLMAVLGISSAISPTGVAVAPEALAFDLPVMVMVALACLPVFFTGGIISRWEGLLFLGYYVAYTIFLIFNATANPALPLFSQIMLYAVIPLTVIFFAVTTVQAVRKRGS
ncbi:MAG: calcium/sodium antiporter [Caldilineaceae bacterium]|nr:calcium/sodium antiporter [Caldilineaceae bacterium]